MHDNDDQLVVPEHVGYVVDGNRRWAKEHGLPVYEGHLAGYNTLKDIALATLESGVKYLSVYVFSTENWKRNADEVKSLLGLILKLVTSDLPEFQKHNVRLRIAGSRDGVSEKMLKAIDTAELETAHNTGGELIICFNYGGQLEIAEAVSKMIEAGVEASDVTPELVEHNLYAPEVPPLDVIVRTSGEKRLSNFMLWRAAYSEFIFLDKNWPDMTKDDVTSIIKEYTQRGRRFGS